MKTTVINIYGAPGSGKSTLAAELYTWMKQQGYSVELVRECIKRWAWSGHRPTVFEQTYITNEQMLEESSLYGKVEYLITDSPIVLGDFYCKYYHDSDGLYELDDHIYKEAYKRGLITDCINLYVPIKEEIYKTEGRYSSLEEAKKLDVRMFDYLKNEGHQFMDLCGPPCNRKISSIEYILGRKKNENI